jgi:hypothetical protein
MLNVGVVVELEVLLKVETLQVVAELGVTMLRKPYQYRLPILIQ